MKKLLLLLFIGIVGIGTAQNVNIPDANFKAYLVGNAAINTNGDAEIQLSEAAAFNGGINCQAMNISDLTGIEAFTNLETLKCSNNPLTSLDVSQNTALTQLDCIDNQLTSLDVNGANALESLYCRDNQLTNLDITQNTALSWLSCANNQLTNLDVTQNTAMWMLNCDNNQITSLDVSHNTSLSSSSYYGNQLTCLNVKNGNNSNFTSFYALNNPNLTCIEVDDVAYSTANWTDIDTQTSFSTACNNDCSVGINEANTPSLSIYPNPSSTGLIQLNTSIVNSDINVYSIEGKQINFTQSNNVIDISENEKGVYLVSIEGVVTRYVYQE